MGRITAVLVFWEKQTERTGIQACGKSQEIKWGGKFISYRMEQVEN